MERKAKEERKKKTERDNEVFLLRVRKKFLDFVARNLLGIFLHFPLHVFFFFAAFCNISFGLNAKRRGNRERQLRAD